MSNKIQYLTILDTVTKFDGKRNRLGYKCKCHCGKIKDFVRKSDFDLGKVVSCGCISSKLVSVSLIKEIKPNSTFGLLTVINRTEVKSTEGYKYKCRCICGNIVNVYANRLKRGETKSCGCASIKLNSLNNGGTGIPRENLSLQEAIRTCDKYKKFIADCLKRANGKSELSGDAGEILHVHHIDSVSYLIKMYELSMTNYLECFYLFDLENAIVLTESEHRNFHKEYGHTVTRNDWDSFTNVIKL